jgi:hypothetical protein
MGVVPDGTVAPRRCTGMSCAVAVVSQIPATAAIAARAVTPRPTVLGRLCPDPMQTPRNDADPIRATVLGASKANGRAPETVPTLR